jgi:hypothetical protein
MLSVLFGAAQMPPGTRYIPYAFESQASFDATVNLTWMHDGARGYFPFRDFFLPTPPKPAVVSLEWFWIGLVSRIPFLGDQAAIQIARIVGAMIAVLCLAAVAHYFRGPRGSPWTRLAFLLTAGGLGTYGVLVLLLNNMPIVPAYPLDISTEEFTPFRSLLGTPHHLFVLGLLPVAFLLFVAALERQRSWFALTGGALSAVILATAPYIAPMLLGIPVVAAALIAVFGQTSRGAAVRATTAFVLAALPGLLLQFAATIGNPIAAARYAQNLHPLPSLPILAISVGLLAPLAALGAFLRFGDRRPRTLFLTIWLVIHTALLFLPVPFPRRMVQGLLIPYILLSFDAVAWMWERWIRGRYTLSTATVAGLALTVCVGAPFNVSLIALQPHQPIPRYYAYIPKALDDAFAWIRENTAADASFFGNPSTLNLVVAYTERPVFAAHPVETPDYRARDAVYQELLMSTDGLGASRFLQNEGMRYAIADDRRDTLATGLFSRLPDAHVVFHEDPITIIALQ